MRLSVLVTVVDAGDALRRCIDALLQQTDPPELEILVAWDDTLGSVAEWQARYGSVCFIEIGRLALEHDPRSMAGQHELFDKRRAAALARAKGDVIAMLEDRAVPDADWARTIVRLHEARPEAAIGGAVENGMDRLLNWAVYWCDFGRYQRPLPEGPAGWITDVNLAYKRRAVEQTRELWQHRYHEPTVHWALQRAGEVLWLTPAFAVRQVRDNLSFGGLLRERFAFARLFGYTRAREISFMRRVLLTLASPALPFLLFGRLLVQRIRKHRNVPTFLLASPVTFALLCAWIAGEAFGTLTGRE